MINVYKCFPDGKFKVLTMSYDDGKHADRRLVKIFNDNGIKGTFNVSYGMEGDPIRIPQSGYEELYKGHEIACHTLTHPTIARCPLEQATVQIFEDRKGLEKVTGRMIRGMAYPNGSYSDDVKTLLRLHGIKYARIVGNSDSFDLPTDFYEWKATCHHNHNLLQLGDEFAALTKKQYLYMMYVWGHSYEFDRDNNWEVMEEFCKRLGHRDDIWYATNIEIVEYFEVLDRLEFSADASICYNPSAKSAWLSINNAEKIVEVKGGETVKLF